RGTALADIAAIIEGDIPCIALIKAAAQSYAGTILDPPGAAAAVGASALAVVAVFLENVVHGSGGTPLVPHFLGDEIEHTAHGFGAVQGSHGPAAHLDAFNARHRRHEAGGGLAEAVGRDVARRILTASIDQDQGVLTGHAAQADVQTAGFAGALA